MAGIGLSQSGFDDFVVLERASALGGTWRDNRYPGVACDVPGAYYCYSFEPNGDPKTTFASGSELLRYFMRIADKYRVAEKIRYNSEVKSAIWTGRDWILTTTNDDEYRSDIVITAVGRLHRPKTPDIAGLEDFEGRITHSSAWDPSISLTSRRVGVIGTGSSGTQIISAIAGEVKHLDIFQRTAQWVIPLANEQIPVWRRVPLRLSSRYRKRSYRQAADLVDRFASGFVNSPKATEARKRACLRALATIRDPELRAKLTPSYELGCKRLVVSKAFYDAVQLPNVEVVTEKILRVEANGVRTVDGQFHPIDLLILATGFHADAYLRPMTVTGEGGITLDEIWSNIPVNYKSVALPHMPNFFMVNGPYSPGGSTSLIAVIETHVAYITKLVRRIVTEDVAISPRPDRTAELLDAVREKAKQTVWYTGGCTSWYLGKDGVPLVNPQIKPELERDLAEPDYRDFDIVPRSATPLAV